MSIEVTFPQVQAALRRCLAEHPPIELRLCPDASLLADVFGEMNYWGEPARALGRFTERQREAFERWHLNPSKAGQ